MRTPLLLSVAFVLAFALGCTRKPVLYPNAKYVYVGKDEAEADVDRCSEWADAAGAGTNRAGRVAGSTAGGAVVGGAVGGAAGAIRGHAGRGAATGAAGAAAGGLVRGLFRWREPDAVEKRFIETCLREQGYQPIGWR